MDCSQCNLRSAVGYCVACQTMLCEDCGLTCDDCGKLACSEHVYETRRGRKLCPACRDEREARKAERKGRRDEIERAHAEAPMGGTSFEDLVSSDAVATSADGEPVTVSVEALGRSGYRKWQPWQLSMLSAVLGLMATVVTFLVPSLRGIMLGDGSYIPAPLIIVFFPLAAFAWAFVGLTYANFWEDREKCFVSAGLGALCIFLLFGEFWTDPTRELQRQPQVVERTRDEMNFEELARWRESILNRYR